jgi:hypothetical protein
MLNLLRKFLRPTLREQLEDGVREALKRYAERHAAPNLRVYVSTDLLPEGIEQSLWARDEGEHLRRFALQWAEDNHVSRAGLRVEVILLDTKREFAFVKPLGLAEKEPEADAPAAAPAPDRPLAERGTPGVAVLEVIEPAADARSVRVNGEMTVGRKSDAEGVVGLGDRYMSARHARFHLAAGSLYLTDLDSKNRTFLNDRPIPPHEPVPAKVGDLVRMGSTTLRVAEVGG